MKHNKFDLTSGREDQFFDWFDDFIPMFPRRDMKELHSIMKTDIKETEKNYVLEVDLPGFDKKDVGLELKNGYLSISAKREQKVDENDEKGGFIRRERSFGQFSRSFYVGDIDESDIDAKLENGILTILLPKKDKKEAKSNRIEIK